MQSRPGEFWVVSDRVLVALAHTTPSQSCADDLVEMPLGVLVRDGRIAELRAAHELRKPPGLRDEQHQELVVYDVGSSPIVPGWVNAHTHLAMSALRGLTNQSVRSGNVVTDLFFRLESALTADDVFSFTCLGAYESLLSGCLYVFDHYYFGDAVARALAHVGLPGMVAPTLQDKGGPFAHAWEKQLAVTLDIAADQQLSSLGITSAFGPHASDTVSVEALGHIADLAVKHGLPVHMHLAQSLEEVAEMQRSYGSVDHGFATVADALGDSRVMIAHGLHLSRARIVDLAKRGWLLAYCPYSQLQFGVLGPLDAWSAAGGVVALGTDCVASNDALDVQRELPLVAGNAALATSFGPERRALLDSGQLLSAERLETARKDAVQSASLIEPNVLLKLGDGRAFDAWSYPLRARGACSPLRVGAVANFLILDEHHPALFPGENLARTLCYGSTAGAIQWGVVAGRPVGKQEGWQRAWLSNAKYVDMVSEARQRKTELFARARLT